MTATTRTVREIALEEPTSIRVFEHFGIDYCCGGRKPLAEACAANDLEVDAVIAALEAAAQGPAPAAENWAGASLEKLAAHIVATHHVYVKGELPRLAVLAEKVVRRHGDTQAELPVIQAKLAQLSEELSGHLAKEEVVLFPHVTKLERALATGSTLPRGCFGTVANPIATMAAEHDAAGGLLAEIRELSDDYTTPAGACPTYCAFFAGLKEFEQDLHQHIHLENNILFPRAIEMEAGAARINA
ncbi:MAG TPA: iron-sulfur cluster repair di-iron protein [Acidobacteriaceae bacterium]|jgi:regulator of cell morphogenesis and NO signaling